MSVWCLVPNLRSTCSLNEDEGMISGARERRTSETSDSNSDYCGIRLQLSTADSETHKVREISRAYSRYETRVNSTREFFANARLVDVHIFKNVYEDLYEREAAAWRRAKKCRNNVKKKKKKKNVCETKA